MKIFFKKIAFFLNIRPDIYWLNFFIFILLLAGNGIFKKPVLVLMLIFYIFGAIVNLKIFVAVIFRSKIFLIFWVYFIISYTWSVVPEISVDQILTQTAFVMMASAIAVLHRDDFHESFGSAAVLLIPIIIGFSLFVPSQAMSADGLRGIYAHKNNLGAMLAICILILIYAPNPKKYHRWLIGAGIGLLLLSQSMTSIGGVIVTILLLHLVEWLRKGMSVDLKKPIPILTNFVAYGLASAAALMLIVFRFELFDYIIDNLPPEALTGRGQLWVAVIYQLQPNSLLGVGPGGMWQANGQSEITLTNLFREDPYWVQNMVASDGSYIDIVASIGTVGLALFLLTAFNFYRLLFKNWDMRDRNLAFVTITFVLIQAITESTLLYSTNILWLIYLVYYFKVIEYDTNKVHSSSL